MSDQDKDKEPFTPTSFTGTVANFFSAPHSKEDFDQRSLRLRANWVYRFSELTGLSMQEQNKFYQDQYAQISTWWNSVSCKSANQVS